MINGPGQKGIFFLPVMASRIYQGRLQQDHLGSDICPLECTYDAEVPCTIRHVPIMSLNHMIRNQKKREGILQKKKNSECQIIYNPMGNSGH